MTSMAQLPFLIAACDYTLIGDELLVAGAYLARDPVKMGSIAGLAGVLMVAEYFLSPGILKTWGLEMQNWGVIIAAFSLGLAAVSLISTHTRRLVERRGEWWNSVLLLAALFVTVVSGVVSRQTPAFKFIFEQMISPLGAAFYSMVAYYLLSAAYRTFRARSVEATACLSALP